MTYRDDAAADDPLSKVARSLLESAQRIAQIDDEAPQAPNNSDHGERARRLLDDAGATAKTILLQARAMATEEQGRLTAKVDESHERIRTLLSELDFGQAPSIATPGPLALPPAAAMHGPTFPTGLVPPIVAPEQPSPIDALHEPVPRPPAPTIRPVEAPAPTAVRLEPYPAAEAAPDSWVRLPATRVREPWTPMPWLRSLFRVPGEMAGLTTQRRRWAETFLWVRNVGVITLLFVVYQLWGTGVGQARSQRALLHDFTAAASGGTAAAAPSGSLGTAAASALPPPPVGKAVAVLKIAKIGVTQAVVEGTGTDDLRKGPGHYRGTPLPGEHGNVAIAGHRTTYGAPFHRLDELERGDPILLNTRVGVVRYVVAAKRVVNPDQRGAIQPTKDDRLTLTTCHPKYSASQRLIVIAALAPDATPADSAGRSNVAPAPISASQLATPTRRARPVTDIRNGPDGGALLPTIGWGLLLLLFTLRARHMAWERLQRYAYLLASPVVLALLVLFFERLDRLLPPNY
jgi:sortase A